MEPTLSSDLLRGHTETIVLGILLKQDRYGFEIYNAVLERTNGRYELKETTLYSSYKRLEKEGCIVSYWGDETQGARRKYYRITDKGREMYRQSKLDWEFTQTIINDLLREEAYQHEQYKTRLCGAIKESDCPFAGNRQA